MLAVHYDVHQYRCPAPACGLLLRNWSAFTVHRRSHRREVPVEEVEEAVEGAEWHLLEEPVFLGEERGLAVARSYHAMDRALGLHRCSLCSFTAKCQQTSMHVLAKHLPMLHLYRCPVCQRDFRYSRVRFREHVAQHTVGKLRCAQCRGSVQEYTSDSLRAHARRVHTLGRFACAVPECAAVFATRAEAREHERAAHLLGLPAKCASHVCDNCDYAFPTRTRWKKHVVVCARGTSRTGFRKQIADVLQWLGGGAYRCTFCSAEFHPEADNVTRTALPEARNHVATLHGMKHMRKAKMQWHGDPKGVNKQEIYRDKSCFWSQKVKDIERARSAAAQESKLFTIQHEVNETIAEAEAESHHALGGGVEGQEGRQVVINVIGAGGELEARQVVVAGSGERLVLGELGEELGGAMEEEVVFEEGEVEDTVILSLGEEGMGGMEEQDLQYVEVVGEEI